MTLRLKTLLNAIIRQIKAGDEIPFFPQNKKTPAIELVRNCRCFFVLACPAAGGRGCRSVSDEIPEKRDEKKPRVTHPYLFPTALGTANQSRQMMPKVMILRNWMDIWNSEDNHLCLSSLFLMIVLFSTDWACIIKGNTNATNINDICRFIDNLLRRDLDLLCEYRQNCRQPE